MVAAKAADFSLDVALLVRAFQTRLAVEDLQAIVGVEGGPPLGLYSGPGEAQHLGNGGYRTLPLGTPLIWGPWCQEMACAGRPDGSLSEAPGTLVS